MAKRSRDAAEGADRESVAKKIARRLNGPEISVSTAQNARNASDAENVEGEGLNGNGQLTDHSNKSGPSKAERKVLKRERKALGQTSSSQEASQIVAIRAAYPNALGRVKPKLNPSKRASKPHDAADANAIGDQAPMSHSGNSSTGAKNPYQEHARLAAVPHAELEAYLSDKGLSLFDPRHEYLRPITSFQSLLGDDKACSAFANFTEPTAIQAACWPYLLAGRDVVGVAETGSGKTFAFGFPCVQHISRFSRKVRKGVTACIVSPTRELALQTHEQLVQLAEPAGLKVTCVYGGTKKDEQRLTLKGTDIIVATPGRLNDFIDDGSINLSAVTYLVLDEADRMLDKGFEKDVRKIISTTSADGRQTLMFTATWPPSVQDLAATFMREPVKITMGLESNKGELQANKSIQQHVEVLQQEQKQGRLIQLLKEHRIGKYKNDRILVFCLYKKEATRIEEFIRRKGFNVAGIHGDLNQQKRIESLAAFKEGIVPLLVATDVAARGLDIPAVKLVINFTFPLTAEDYVHRIGRTGRAGRDGKAITFFTENEKGLAGALINILKAANQQVPEELLKFGTTVKKKGHDAYGAFFRATTDDMPKARKITFD